MSAHHWLTHRMLAHDVLESRRGRLFAFSLLYLSEGIPFGFSAIALATYLRMQGVGVAEIGVFTASLYAPWGLKWAWAPLVDLIPFRRYGSRRTWIVAAQSGMIATLGLLALFDFTADLRMLTTIVVVHNVFAATQDVAIDALAVKVLPESERGLANGFMFGAAFLGQAIGGSGALYVANAFGFGMAFPFVLTAMLLIMVGVSMRLQEPEDVVELGTAAGEVLLLFAQRLWTLLGELYRGFFRSGAGPLVGVAFAVIPVGAMSLGLALGNTLQVDMGLDEGQIANLTAVTTTAGAVGCLLGGWVADRVGHRKALTVWLLLAALPALYLAAQFTGEGGVEGVGLWEYYAVSVVHSLVLGLEYGAAMAIYMGLTNPAVAATQFTGYMALGNLRLSMGNVWQTAWVESHGYAATLTLDALLVVVPILLIPFLRPARRAAG